MSGSELARLGDGRGVPLLARTAAKRAPENDDWMNDMSRLSAAKFLYRLGDERAAAAFDALATDAHVMGFVRFQAKRYRRKIRTEAFLNMTVEQRVIDEVRSLGSRNWIARMLMPVSPFLLAVAIRRYEVQIDVKQSAAGSDRAGAADGGSGCRRECCAPSRMSAGQMLFVDGGRGVRVEARRLRLQHQAHLRLAADRAPASTAVPSCSSTTQGFGVLGGIYRSRDRDRAVPALAAADVSVSTNDSQDPASYTATSFFGEVRRHASVISSRKDHPADLYTILNTFRIGEWLFRKSNGAISPVIPRASLPSPTKATCAYDAVMGRISC